MDVCAHLLLTMLAVVGVASWQLVLLAALQESRQAVCCVLGMHVGALHLACDAVGRLEVTLSGLGAGSLHLFDEDRVAGSILVKNQARFLT